MVDDDSPPGGLSRREREVARAYAAGASYKEIARELGVSPTTVRSHLRTLYGKLGVTSKIALAQAMNDGATPEAPQDSASVAAELALELDEAVRRERSLAKVLRIISDQDGELDAVIDAVLDHALEICEAEFGILFRHEGDLRFRELRSRNIPSAFAEWLREQDVFEVDPDTGLGRVASGLQAVNIADVRAEDVYGSGAPLRTATADLGRARSFAAIPMVSGGRLIGVFTVYRTRLHPFGERALELAQVFADQAAIAIENVRRFRELRIRLDRQDATRRILEAIKDARGDERPVFDAILGNARRLCDAPFAALVLGRDGDTHQVMAAHHGAVEHTVDLYRQGAIPMDPAKSFAARAILERRVVHLPNMRETDEYRAGVPNVRALCDVQGIRTNLLVPLIADGEGIGCIIIFRHEVRPYTDDQIALVETFADQAVIGIETVRRFRAVEARLQREAANREILKVISESGRDEGPVFDAILENACRLCDAPLAYLSMATEDRAHVVSPARRGAFARFGATLDRLRVPLDESRLALARAISERRVFREDDIADHDLYRSGDPNRVSMVDDEGARSLLVVPLIRSGLGIGAITLYRREVAPFSDDDVALVESFAAQAVIAIENARRFKEVQSRLARERGTSEILRLLSRSREDDAPVFDLILREAAELCGADAAALTLGRAGDAHQRLAASRGVHPSTKAQYEAGRVSMRPTSFAAQAILSGAPVHVEDFAQAEGYRAGDPAMRSLVEETGMRTSLFVPLMSSAGGIGALVLFRREVRPYVPDEIALVETFAAQAVIAIENVEQFRALERLNAELGARVEAQVGEIERMGRLKRFLSPAVAEALATRGDDDALASHRSLIATLFCDIRGFTAFCERAEPEETIEVLQTYHEEMSKLIAAHGAGVDKRMGDGIMVIFNDPFPCEDPAGDAVRLAVAMRDRMAGLCRGWKRLGHRLGFGVGISLGYATIGMVGSEGRFDYTASGTAVNLAARLCDRAEDGEILLSPRAFTAVEHDFPAHSSGELELKGIREPVEVFRLADC